MAEQRESSVIFSLEGLMQRERERIHEEEAEHRERLRQAHERQVLAERRAREIEERRRTEQEKRLLTEQQRARQEAARLEALRRAEVERARVEAEARARLELMAQEHEHVRRLEAIRNDVKHRRDRLLALASSVFAGLLVLCAGALWFGKLEPQSARLQAAYDELVIAERHRADETQLLVTRAEQQRASLLAELEQTTAELRDLKAENERLRRARPDGLGKRTAVSGPRARQDCRDDGDPLNGCLIERQ